MGNYIDRDALMKHYEDAGLYCGYEGAEYLAYYEAINSVMDYVQGMPTATVKLVVHGKWIPFERDYGDGTETDFRCSACGYDDLTDESMKFCPMCGANMSFNLEDNSNGSNL